MNTILKKEINTILEKLGGELDITKTEYEMAVNSYNDVGDWLSKDDSSLSKFNPSILPQGSFMLGTMIRPVNPEDDLDIDLVCKLDSIPSTWSQEDLKEAVGNRLKEHKRYNDNLKDKNGGQRCWTIKYAEASNYHLDVLPCIADSNYLQFLNESYYTDSELDVDKLAIKITDNESESYKLIIPHEDWDKSNPFGFAKWFLKQAHISQLKLITLNESIKPVEDFEKEKLPLKVIVQLLKRHRDIMFTDKKYNTENKPISIIITTLAGLSYNKANNVIDGLSGIIKNIHRHIKKDVWNVDNNSYETWIENPINSSENFANKWTLEKQKEDYFYMWLNKLEKDFADILNSENRGFKSLNESLSLQFGADLTSKVFKSVAMKTKDKRDSGILKMATGTGLLGSTGTSVKKHEFYGELEK
jgi:hypothetical protein